MNSVQELANDGQDQWSGAREDVRLAGYPQQLGVKEAWLAECLSWVLYHCAQMYRYTLMHFYGSKTENSVQPGQISLSAATALLIGPLAKRSDLVGDVHGTT